MIGFIALGIVMLIWVLCWENEDAVALEQTASEPGGAQDPQPAV